MSLNDLGINLSELWNEIRQVKAELDRINHFETPLSGSGGFAPSPHGLSSAHHNSFLTAALGGTGITSYTVGDLLYASGATTLSKLADVVTGNALISGGVGVAPSWDKIGLTTHVSGILPVGNGGTGTTTQFTPGSVIFAGAAGVYTEDNPNFIWNNTDNRLGIVTATPVTTLHVNGQGSFGDSVTAGNAVRALNLVSTDAVMRVLRVSADIDAASPSVELIHRTTADGADTDYWDFFVNSNGFNIRDRAPSNNTRLTIDGNGNVGFGTTTPTYPVHIVKEWGSVSAANLSLSIDSYGDVARFTLRQANGTVSVPTQVLASGTLGNINWRGWHSGGAFSTVGVAAVAALAAENFTATAQGTYLVFVTAQIGGTSAFTKMLLSDTGNLGIGITANTGFGTNAAAVIAIKSSVAPSTSPPDTIQIWEADRNSVANKGSIHWRVEDNNAVGVIGDFSGFGTVDPVSNVDISATAGGILTLSRNDTTVSAADPIGRLQWWNNDATLTTQNIYGYIEMQAAQTITTDAAAGKLVVAVTGTTAGGSPVEQFNIVNGLMTLKDAFDIAVNTTTGTKIGTATTQKLGFHNSTPTVQRSGAVQAAVATTASTNILPFGYTTQAQADAIVTLVNELRAMAVEKGLMKGSA